MLLPPIRVEAKRIFVKFYVAKRKAPEGAAEKIFKEKKRRIRPAAPRPFRQCATERISNMSAPKAATSLFTAKKLRRKERPRRSIYATSLRSGALLRFPCFHIVEAGARIFGPGARAIVAHLDGPVTELAQGLLQRSRLNAGFPFLLQASLKTGNEPYRKMSRFHSLSSSSSEMRASGTDSRHPVRQTENACRTGKHAASENANAFQLHNCISLYEGVWGKSFPPAGSGAGDAGSARSPGRRRHTLSK